MLQARYSLVRLSGSWCRLRMATDPAEPKLVPKEQWYAAPAKPPSEPHPG